MAVLGMVEFSTIAAGVRGSDAMVKAAPVELLESRPIDPGKYMALVTGDVASVEASVRAGRSSDEAKVLEWFVLANLEEQIMPALRGQAAAPARNAVGVLETRTSAAIIEGADAACKASAVILMKLRIALHIGGKGYALFVGEVADVETAIAAGALAAGEALLDRVVIPNPYGELFEKLVKPDDLGPCDR